MRYGWLGFLLLISGTSFSQQDTTTSELIIGPSDAMDDDDISSLDLLYGQKIYQWNFYNQFSSGSRVNLSLPVHLAGIGYSGQMNVNRAYSLFGQMSYCQVLPQTIIVQDTLKCKVGGFMFTGFVWGKKVGYRRFSCYLSLGFNTGRLRLYDDERVRQKDPFFSPMVSVLPKIALGRLAVSMRIDYEYDLSRPGWRRTLFSTGPKTNLDHFRQSGFTVFLCLGIMSF